MFKTLETYKYRELSAGLRELKKQWNNNKGSLGWNIYLFISDAANIPTDYIYDYFPKILWKITGAELEAAEVLCNTVGLFGGEATISKLLECNQIFFEESEDNSENRNVCMYNEVGEKIAVSSATMKQLEVQKKGPKKFGGRYVLATSYINLETVEVVGNPEIKGYDDVFEGFKETERLWWERPLHPADDNGDAIMEDCMLATTLYYACVEFDSKGNFTLSRQEEWAGWMIVAAEYILLQAGLTMNIETICAGMTNQTIFHLMAGDSDNGIERSIEAEFLGEKYSCGLEKSVAIRSVFKSRKGMEDGWVQFEADWTETHE